MKTINYLLAVIFISSSIAISAQKSTINLEKSSIEWLGKKVTGEHSGNIQLKSGSLELKGDKILNGSIVMDMNSITNTDIEDASYGAKLVGHLKSEDFFGVEKYPTASFTITDATSFSDGKAMVTGDLTIKDKTESISFDLTNSENTYTGKMEIDRTKFDVKYGSGSFFDNLGDKTIDDIFTLDFTLILE